MLIVVLNRPQMIQLCFQSHLIILIVTYLWWELESSSYPWGSAMICNLCSLPNIRAHDRSKSVTWFSITCRHLHSHAVFHIEHNWYVLLKMAESSIIFLLITKHVYLYIYKSKCFFELLLQRKLLFIRIYTQNIWRAFWPYTPTHVETFAPFKQVWSLSFFPSTAVLCNASAWYFDLELKPLLDLLNTGFTSVKNGLIYGGEYRSGKLQNRFFFYSWQNYVIFIYYWQNYVIFI